MSKFWLFKNSHYQFISAYFLFLNMNTLLYLFFLDFFFAFIFFNGMRTSHNVFYVLFLMSRLWPGIFNANEYVRIFIHSFI